ncbi:hypothetical protein [Azospirillum largimobile]
MVVLLGEPGLGKTQAFKHAAREDDGAVHRTVSRFLRAGRPAAWQDAVSLTRWTNTGRGSPMVGARQTIFSARWKNSTDRSCACPAGPSMPALKAVADRLMAVLLLVT